MQFKIHCFCTLIHLFSTSWCFDADIDMEGTFNIGKDLLNVLRYSFPDVFQQNSRKTEPNYKNIKMREFIPDKNGTIFYKAEQQLESRKSLESKNISDEAPIKRTTERLNINNNNNLFSDIKSQLSTEGELKLKTLGNKVKNHLNPKLDIYDILQNVTRSYAADFDKKADIITKYEFQHDIEREFYILDMVETSNQLFLNNSKTLFSHIISHKNSSLPSNKKTTLTQDLQIAVVDEKKDNLKYVCEKAHVCRLFPAYLDYVAELLNKILKLPDSKVQTIVDELQNILVLKWDIFKAMLGDDLVQKVSIQSKSMAEKLPNSRRMLSIMKEVLIHRYKIYRSKDGEIKMRNRALRILLDLIDKMFEILEENILEIQFNSIKRGLKGWILGDHDDIKTTLTHFCNNFLDVLKLYWIPDTKNEVLSIMEVILTGTTTNNSIDVYDLFTKGSKLVRGDHVFATKEIS